MPSIEGRYFTWGHLYDGRDLTEDDGLYYRECADQAAAIVVDEAQPQPDRDAAVERLYAYSKLASQYIDWESGMMHTDDDFVWAALIKAQDIYVQRPKSKGPMDLTTLQHALPDAMPAKSIESHRRSESACVRTARHASRSWPYAWPSKLPHKTSHTTNYVDELDEAMDTLAGAMTKSTIRPTPVRSKRSHTNTMFSVSGTESGGNPYDENPDPTRAFMRGDAFGFLQTMSGKFIHKPAPEPEPPASEAKPSVPSRKQRPRTRPRTQRLAGAAAVPEPSKHEFRQRDDQGSLPARQTAVESRRHNPMSREGRRLVSALLRMPSAA